MGNTALFEGISSAGTNSQGESGANIDIYTRRTRYLNNNYAPEIRREDARATMATLKTTIYGIQKGLEDIAQYTPETMKRLHEDLEGQAEQGELVKLQATVNKLSLIMEVLGS